MKGNEKVIAALNSGLHIELTAINQYFVQAKMCRKWGYHRLAEKHYQESLGEMRHAEQIIDRLLFLGDTPAPDTRPIHTGSDVKKQLENDLTMELHGVQVYNDGVNVCLAVKDAGSREVMEHILVSSEEHVEWLETQLHLIDEIGLDNYLAGQIGAEQE